jgi:hypothetical protein
MILIFEEPSSVNKCHDITVICTSLLMLLMICCESIMKSAKLNSMCLKGIFQKARSTYLVVVLGKCSLLY